MNCYDFDKTIYQKDCSLKFFFFCLKKNPLLLFHLFKCCCIAVLYSLGWINLKSYKEKFFKFLSKIKNVDNLIDAFWRKEIKYINPWYLAQKSATDVVCSASPEFLVKPALQLINPDAVVICTQMEITTGKISGQNLKGQAKVDAIKEHFKNTSVVFENAYSDSESDLPMLDLAKNRFIIGKGNIPYMYGKQRISFGRKIHYIVKSLRLKHYLKNVLIFLPLFFSGLLTNTSDLMNTLFGFISFCLIASSVYIVNDLIDVRNDRQHSHKRTRPVACYMVSPYEAIIVAVLLAFTSFGLLFMFLGANHWVIGLVVVYVLLNLAYSLFLKKIAVVDVFVVAACYILRIFFGGVIIGVSVSKWLYLTVLCGALYMAFGKRRNEIKNEGKQTRKVSDLYPVTFLDKSLYLCLTACLVFYSLWATNVVSDLNVVSKFLILLTIPLVYFIMIKYSFNIEKNKSIDDPVDVFLSDFVLIFAAGIFVALMVIAFYTSISF